MSLTAAIKDTKRISQGDFSVKAVFTNTAQTETAEVNVLGSLHFLSLNPESGSPINSQNCHITVHEEVLNEAGYTTRNSQNDIALKGHKIERSFQGKLFTWKVNECYPDHTTGLIVCVLGRMTAGTDENPQHG